MTWRRLVGKAETRPPGERIETGGAYSGLLQRHGAGLPLAGFA